MVNIYYNDNNTVGRHLECVDEVEKKMKTSFLFADPKPSHSLLIFSCDS